MDRRFLPNRIPTLLIYPYYAPRAPPMRSARDGESISESVHRGEMVLIWFRPRSGGNCLILKMSRRKNLAGGCSTKRASLCIDGSPMGREICPPRKTRPLIAEGVKRWGVPPSYTRRNFNRIPNATRAKIGFHKWPQKRRYGF